MSPLLASILLATSQASPEQALLDGVVRAVGSGNFSQVQALFARAEDARYLSEAVNRRGGLRAWRVNMVDAPSDRREAGQVWVVFHARHDIQEDRDVVVPVIRTGDGLRLGKEIPEWAPDKYQIDQQHVDALLQPDRGSITVQTRVEFRTSASARSVVMRLGQPYVLQRASIQTGDLKVENAEPGTRVKADPGEALKVGGLVIIDSEKALEHATLRYQGSINTPTEDKITTNVAYITAWWLPSIGRLPFTTRTNVTGPKDWTLISEGEPIQTRGATLFGAMENTQTVQFECSLPIAYPKIVGGKYTMAAEKVVDGRTYRSYQLDPVEPERAKRDVELIADSIAWFEKNLGKFPFSRYFVFDADTYYGIESYSYTLLRRSITTQFVTHEIGHTYFGGIVPCAYTRDTWNESLTQYVDSVLYAQNRDGSLQAGLRSINLQKPLSKMDVAHADGSSTYYRGAYVMRMLENEIGLPAMLKAMQEMVATRRGKPTIWDDLRPYFERAGGQDLKWFWDQWIHGATFPTVAVTDAQTVSRDGKWRNFVRIGQTGDRNFRLRVRVVLRRFSEKWEQDVVLDGNQKTVTIDTPLQPSEASVEVFGLALARTGQPLAVKL